MERDLVPPCHASLAKRTPRSRQLHQGQQRLDTVYIRLCRRFLYHLVLGAVRAIDGLVRAQPVHIGAMASRSVSE